MAPPKSISLHGVFMDVLGLGVLITGESAAGKSELALELISRGHALVADDAPEFQIDAEGEISGRCPALLQDFLEVRGLGVLNVRAMYGPAAVRGHKTLNLIIDLQAQGKCNLANLDRLRGQYDSRTVLDHAVPVTALPVVSGRNLAVMVEAAVRNHELRAGGYDAAEDLAKRLRRLINEAGT